MTSKLTDAPEQIFASQDSDGWRWPRASKFPDQGKHENFCYVRVDLYNAIHDKMTVAIQTLITAQIYIADLESHIGAEGTSISTDYAAAAYHLALEKLEPSK